MGLTGGAAAAAAVGCPLATYVPCPLADDNRTLSTLLLKRSVPVDAALIITPGYLATGAKAPAARGNIMFYNESAVGFAGAGLYVLLVLVLLVLMVLVLLVLLVLLVPTLLLP